MPTPTRIKRGQRTESRMAGRQGQRSTGSRQGGRGVGGLRGQRSAGDAETEAALVAATRNKKNAERELQDTTQALSRANREEDDQSRGLDNLRAQMDSLTKTMTDAMNSLEAVRAKKLQLKQAQAALEQQVSAANSAIEAALQRAEAAAAAAAVPVKQETAVILGEADIAQPGSVVAAPAPAPASDIMDIFAPASPAPAPAPAPASMMLASDAGGSNGSPRYYWTRRYGGGTRSQCAQSGAKKEETTEVSHGVAPAPPAAPAPDARMHNLRFGGRSLEAATRAQERQLEKGANKRTNK